LLIEIKYKAGKKITGAFTMRTVMTAMLALSVASGASASELVHQFSSPAFSGQGYSAHVLTIEQLETQRRQKLQDQQQAVIDKAERDAKNTTLAKFIVNLESRIYAQLSKQLADNMFGESDKNTGTLDFQGSSITWLKNGSTVTLTIIDTNSNRTEVVVPIASFAF
jgi:curli production assembly/transport component CsgF